ncbi:sensor histidine kinase [Marivivens aquimaris]|uniref:sensor histidine kinase n=1 Tax=Marivivens aquimaris TaxID=2774876 RepID=UPI0018807E95|nr:sensor histidine kinase [Marivivens aquimaris]
MSRNSRPRSLVTRLTAAVFFILLAGGLLVAGATFYNGQQAARTAFDRVLVGAASDIAESIRIQDGWPIVDLPVSAFELLAQAPDDRIYYSVRGPGGTAITGLGGDVLLDAPRTNTQPVFINDALQGEEARFVVLPRIFAERDFSGEITVIVGQTLRARRDMALNLMIDALWPMALAGAALLVFAWFAIRSAMRPLEAVSDDLTHRDPYDLTPMSTEGMPREPKVMLDAMNRFMGRLDNQFDAMRNVISDTAHQLRTPVAAIRVLAETTLEEQDQTARDRAMERLLLRTRSLGTLLDQLLSRALVIHRTEAAPRVEFDLREVALDIIERRDHDLLAPDKEVRLIIGEDPVPVSTDEFSVGEAAKNLLSNALKYGKAPVLIGVDHIGNEASIWVQDTGAGPDDAIIDRLGQRFARSVNSREESIGLGLSIVASVASAFDGRVDMRKNEEGFRISLVLPARTKGPSV